ncbi:DNA polymerase III, subunit gamma and tau [[Phormidium ambiguum] IAM M-71]|uniref:DNA polymerase III subunit gamma/tau n=1 Tax=[Phormidium ambiguum] IAM M-71 TaxID=454136 RepID=A0A1U7I426_9CYAN|nr:DNA polymerase III subunit gamma/tau [Phormidium ambiguum]OKH30915.1 DNA polymerase III, subunit gamma and tau [Phormidium ambiguum IAM M-71]
MYQPFHQKYRPQILADLVGQNPIATALTNAINSSRIASAYLFTGPRGTGKTSSARILAKSLNCLETDSPTASPCGCCSSCRDIANGVAIDVLELDAASNNGVDQIREICTGAHLTPVQGRYKVYAIDEAHGLSNAATQALLKTLEEPPPNVVFILCTTEPQKLPNTIISRCQRYNFQRISLAAMVEHLKTVAKVEGIIIDEVAIGLVAQLATGGLRDALSLLSQLSLLDKFITTQEVWELVGAVPEQELVELVRAIASDQEWDTINIIRSLLNSGKEPLVVLQNLIEFYTKMLIDLTVSDNQLNSLLLEVSAEQCKELAISLGRHAILAAQQHLRTCEAQIKFSNQSWLWLEVAILGLLPSAMPSHNHDNLHNTSTSATSSIALPTSAVVPHNNIWQTVLAKVPPSLKVLLSQHGSLTNFSEDTATVFVKSAALKQRVDSQITALESAFSSVTSRPIKVSVSN